MMPPNATRTTPPTRTPFGPNSGASWAEIHATPGAKLTRFQVLGERSSGTNYLDTLLHQNLAATPAQQFQWKHGYPLTHFIPRDLLTIVSFRAPEDWVRSMHRKPWHTPERFWSLPISDFLRTPWRSEVDDWIIRDDLRELGRLEATWRFHAAKFWNHHIRPRYGIHRGWVAPSQAVKRAAFGLPIQHDLHPIDGTPFDNLLQMRGMKMRAHLSLRARGCSYVFVPFEAVRDAPEAFVDMLAQKLHLARRGPFKPVDGWKGTLPPGAATQSADAAQQLSAEDRRFVWQQLDHDLEAQLGYGPG